MNLRKSDFYSFLSNLNQTKWSVAGKGLVCGIVSGLLVVLYRLGIEYGTQTAIQVYAYLKEHPFFLLPWVGAACAAGVFIAWLVRLEPMATGSGIPQVEGILLYGFRIKWYTVLCVRFIAGILASFFGLSLGREGPSIQIGASGSQAIAKKLSRNKLEENCLITGGAAAGLSAAFNAPLSGIVFALEEVHRSFSPLILMAATTASLTADVVSKYFFGLKPVLSFTAIPQLPFSCYLWLIPLGILSGLVGVVISKALLGFQTLYRKLPWFLRPVIGLLLALPCGLFLPQVLGGGQNLIRLSESAGTGLSLMFVLFAAKLLFTCTSFGSGIPGGIFLPILSAGALSGSIFGIIASHLGLSPQFIPDFAVCAMAGALSGSVKAPVTSILLTAEMTGSLVHLLPVAACSFLALLLSDLFKMPPIYEALLERIIENNGSTVQNTKIGGLLEIPVEFGSTAAGKMVQEIDWPQGTLIVGIHRGQKGIVPHGTTVLAAGDYLTILASEQTYQENNLSVKKLCHAQTE